MGTFLRRSLAAHAALFAVVGLVALTVPNAASAHAFLIRSAPDAGSRLERSPGELLLYFSEPFVEGSDRLSLRRPSGQPITAPPTDRRGTIVRQPLPTGLRGIVVAHWSVLADDGHPSLGELAFAVGDADELPQLSASASDRTPWGQTASIWLFFAGLALALGGLVSERLIWRNAPADGVVAAPVGLGLVIAVNGALLHLLLLAADRAGGLAKIRSPADLELALDARAGRLTLAILALLAAAAVVARWTRLRPVAVALLLIATVISAARGHSGSSGHIWAVPADAVHLAAAAIWIGALIHLVRVLHGARANERRETLARGARGYASIAVATVAVAIAGGLLTALAQFGSLDQLLETGYGRTLVVKGALIAAALAVALAARTRALGLPWPKIGLLRRLTTAEAAVLVAALVAASLLVNALPPQAAVAANLQAELGPPPLEGPAVRLADFVGQIAVGVAVHERGLRFRVVVPSEETNDVRLTAEAQPPRRPSADLYPRPCGQGCFTIRYRLPRGRTVVTADVGAHGFEGGRARFVVVWPPAPERSDLLRRVAQTMAAVRRLEMSEVVSSDGNSRGSHFDYRLSGRELLRAEMYLGGGVDVRATGRQGDLTELAFALPASDIWYRMWIDPGYRVRREVIINRGHRITRTFQYPAR